MPEIKTNELILSVQTIDDFEGGGLRSITLKNRDISVTIINYGGIITDIYMPDRHGVTQNIVAGYIDYNSYRQNENYFGCILGRFANRIAGGQFKLYNKVYRLPVNNGANHLHGGVEGFNKKLFQVANLIQEHDEIGVELYYLSPDGEEGYPGNLAVRVKYTLNKQNQLQMSYYAETDHATPVNLSNHSYFNLSGFQSADILSHKLQINAQNYVETHDDIPTGNILPVAGSPFDFLRAKLIHPISNTPFSGYNQNYVLDSYEPGKISLAATLTCPESGRCVSIYTDQPGLQLYTANFWDGTITGRQGKQYQQHGAVALETQNFPDSPNQAGFPDCILYPNEIYKYSTIYNFGISK